MWSRVNGTAAGPLLLPKLSEQVVVEAADLSGVVSKYLAEGTAKGDLSVPNRLLNFVVKS